MLIKITKLLECKMEYNFFTWDRIIHSCFGLQSVLNLYSLYYKLRLLLYELLSYSPEIKLLEYEKFRLF